MTDPVNIDDEFSAAFAELNTPSTQTAAAEAATSTTTEASPSATSAASVEAAPAAAVPTEGGTPNVQTAADTSAAPAAGSSAAAPASPSEPAEDWKTRYEELQRAHEAALKRPAPAAEAPRPAEETKPAPQYNDEENTFLSKYREDWPDVFRGEQLQRRAEYQQLVTYMFEQLRPTLEALQSTSERTSSRSQYQDIKDLVTDYDAVRQPTLNWIDTQPDYLKNAYKQVAESGSAKDVADLITRFKKETGYVGAAPAGGSTGVVPAGASAAAPASGAAAPAATAPAAGLAPAAAAAVASLKVVKSSRSEPVTAADPNDFDAAFKEAVASMS